MASPIPNRTEDLSRERDANRSNRPAVKNGELMPVKIPNAKPEWDTTVTRLYNAMKTSGQACYFQNSDWHFAHVILDMLNAQRQASRPSAQMMATIMQGLDKLLLTEAERRRARIELIAPNDEDDIGVVSIAGYKQSLGVVS